MAIVIGSFDIGIPRNVGTSGRPIVVFLLYVSPVSFVRSVVWGRTIVVELIWASAGAISTPGSWKGRVVGVTGMIVLRLVRGRGQRGMSWGLT